MSSTTTLAPTTTTAGSTTSTVAAITTTVAANITNSTGEQNEIEFLISALIILVSGSAFCGVIIFCCKAQTREARRKREEEEQEKVEQQKKMEEELKAREEEREKLMSEREEQIRRELEEQEEIEQARKEGREVDPVYNRDDIFYATAADVPQLKEHPSSLVHTGVNELDHKGMPQPRQGDAQFSKAKSSDTAVGMVQEKKKQPPVVMGMKVISGVDFYRNMYDKTVAQQEAREAANAADAARKNSQPYSYRKKKRNPDAQIAMGEDFASALDRGPGEGPTSIISELPWIGKQNLSAFDPDAFEKAFDELPDDDVQEEIDKKKLASAADVSQSIHARVTGQVLADGKGYSRTEGGGGGANFSLMEAPANRKAREEAEAAARRVDEIEMKKYQKQVEAANAPRKKNQARVVAPASPPVPTQKRQIIAPHLKFDKEDYYASML